MIFVLDLKWEGTSLVKGDRSDKIRKSRLYHLEPHIIK